MGWDDISNSFCPVARALALVGDRWTMSILMELVRGEHRFDGLQAQTGMSSHLLSTRLKRMEHDGLIERRAYSEHPPRYEYHSTKKGRELDPLLMMLRTWGRKWEGDCPDGQPATTLRDKATGAVVDDLSQLSGRAGDFTFDLLEATPGPMFAAERAGRKAAFAARPEKPPAPEPVPASPPKRRAKAAPMAAVAVKPAAKPAPAKKVAVTASKPAHRTRRAT